MSEKPLSSDNILNAFIETIIPVLKKDIAPSKILIFGSRVRGNSTPESDIDVIIVSDFFKGIKFVKRMGIVLKKIRFSRHVDFICYTPEEFKKIQSSSIIVREALSEGISV